MLPYALVAMGLSLLLSTTTTAQDLARQKRAKLAEPWLQNADWTQSMSTAQARAAQSDGFILLFCTRSDLVSPACRATESGLLASAEFARFSKSVAPLCHITTKIPGDSDAALTKVLGKLRFPDLVFLDAKGKILARPSERTLASLQRTKDALTTLRRIDAMKAPLPQSEKVVRFLAQLELQRLDLPSATALAANLGKVTDAQRRKIAQHLINLNVASLYEIARDQRNYRNLGSTFAKMVSRGETPTGKWQRPFWSQILVHARLQRDAKLFRTAVGQYRGILGNDPRFQRIFERYESQLRALGDQK